MDVDLLAASRRRGVRAAAAELLKDWWGLEFRERGGALDLLRFVQAPQTNSRLAWPQDVILPADASRPDGGLIAHENQYLWEARLRTGKSAVEVEFVVDDGARAHDRTMQLDEFILRVLVVSAVFSSARQLQCILQNSVGVLGYKLLDGLELQPHLAHFPMLIADAGWFGLVLTPDRAHVATTLGPAELAARLGESARSWTELTRDGAAEYWTTL